MKEFIKNTKYKEKKNLLNILFFLFILLSNIQGAFSQNIYYISLKYDNEILIDSGKIMNPKVKIKSDYLLINNGLIINKDTFSIDSNVYITYEEYSFNFNPKEGFFMNCNDLRVMITIPKVIYKNIFARIWTNIFYRKYINYCVDYSCSPTTLVRCYEKGSNKSVPIYHEDD